MNGRNPFWLMVLLAVALSAAVPFRTLAQEAAGGPGGGQEIVQTTCPVMEGNKIDPNIYTEYKGKRVYFCCQKCKAAFQANPEKYLDRLPQFADARSEGAGPPGFHAAQFVEAFGLTTLSLLIVTFLLGFFMKKNPKVLHRWHRRFAYVTLVAALSHAALVLLAHNG